MKIEANSKRLIMATLVKRFVISLRISTGKDGWLWYVDETKEWKHMVVTGLHIIENKTTKGLQLFIGPFNLVIAKAK